MFEFALEFFLLTAIAVIAFFLFETTRESWRKALSVCIVLLTLNAAVMAIKDQVERKAYTSKLMQKVGLLTKEVDASTRDLAISNERMTIFQRKAAEDPKDSIRISQLMEEIDRELKSIQDTLRFLLLKLSDLTTGKPIANVPVEIAVRQPRLGGETFTIYYAVSDSRGHVNFGIPVACGEVDLYLRIKDERFEDMISMGAILPGPSVWELHLRPRN